MGKEWHEQGRMIGVVNYDDIVRGFRLYQLQRRPAAAPRHAREQPA